MTPVPTPSPSASGQGGSPQLGEPVLTVISTPPGAAVETGIKTMNGVVTTGTGRPLGTTPVIRAPITAADLSKGPSGDFLLYTNVALPGYVPHMWTIGVGKSGTLQAQEYRIEVVLNRP
jgi:hypothetical protein